MNLTRQAGLSCFGPRWDPLLQLVNSEESDLLTSAFEIIVPFYIKPTPPLPPSGGQVSGVTQALPPFGGPILSPALLALSAALAPHGQLVPAQTLVPPLERMQWCQTQSVGQSLQLEQNRRPTYFDIYCKFFPLYNSESFKFGFHLKVEKAKLITISNLYKKTHQNK